MPELPQSDGQSPRRSPASVALSAGSELVVTVLLFVFAGQWADKKLKTSPWLLLLGVFGGIGIGLYRLIRETSPDKGGGARRP